MNFCCDYLFFLNQLVSWKSNTSILQIQIILFVLQIKLYQNYDSLVLIMLNMLFALGYGNVRSWW